MVVDIALVTQGGELVRRGLACISLFFRDREVNSRDVRSTRLME